MLILLLILFLMLAYGGVMFTGAALEVAGAVLGIVVFLAIAICRRRKK